MQQKQILKISSFSKVKNLIKTSECYRTIESNENPPLERFNFHSLEKVVFFVYDD